MERDYRKVIAANNDAHVIPIGPGSGNHLTMQTCRCEPDRIMDRETMTPVFLHKAMGIGR